MSRMGRVAVGDAGVGVRPVADEGVPCLWGGARGHRAPTGGASPAPPPVTRSDHPIGAPAREPDIP